MRRVLVPRHVPDIAPFAPRVAPILSMAGETMGTTWSVKFAASAQVAQSEVRTAIKRHLALVVSQMSQWEPDSDLSRFNRAAAGSWHVVPEAFFRVLDYALGLARETGGAYDPSIGSLTELWGFGVSPRRGRPDQAAIDRERSRAGWARLAVDKSQRTVLQPGGVQLDLSSVAKGFAVDLVSETLALRGITDYLVEIGGELRGSGTKPDQSPWWVAFEGAEGAPADTVVALYNFSVATSGDARRFIIADRRRLSHTIDPRSGWPIPDRLASVTVFHRSCMRADALATALSVLGAEKGYRFACARQIAARFLLRTDGGIAERITPAFAEMLTD